MFRKLFTKKLLVIALGLMVMGYCVEAYGQRHRHHPPRRAVIRHPVPHYGKIVVRPPVGYITVRVRGVGYFYHGGIFYKRVPSGYIVVRAPFGAVVAAIPVGFVTFIVGGITYYYYGGVYYRSVPSGYMVVETPPGAVVVDEEPSEALPQATVGERLSVSAHTLNVRSGPGMNFEVIGQVYQGNTLIVHGNAPEWLYVELPSGKFGWVLQEFTAPVQPPPSG